MAEIFANYIGGEWVKRAAVFEDRNPANTEEVVGSFVKGTRQDMDDAAQKALDAWVSAANTAQLG